MTETVPSGSVCIPLVLGCCPAENESSIETGPACYPVSAGFQVYFKYTGVFVAFSVQTHPRPPGKLSTCAKLQIPGYRNICATPPPERPSTNTKLQNLECRNIFCSTGARCSRRSSLGARLSMPASPLSRIASFIQISTGVLIEHQQEGI